MISVIQGEYAVSQQPDAVMTTVLGSCIAACLYDPIIKVGGMNHFLLPEATTGPAQNVKYGAYLMELLINEMLKIGADRTRLRAKLAGGAKMNSMLNGVGDKNIAFAKRYLLSEGIPIEWESLGGAQARRVHFYPISGRITEKFVANDLPIEAPRAVKRQERRQDVELF